MIFFRLLVSWLTSNGTTKQRVWMYLWIILLFIQVSFSRAMSLRIRVVSYNVLSSHLSEPSFYSSLKPEHLDPANRLPVVLNKLENEMNKNKNTILCLQEVSYDWAGALHSFCARKGYHVVTGLYGKKFNGYMGVALAWPTSSFEALKVDICRLSDTTEWPPRDELSFFDKVVSTLQTKIEHPVRKIFGMERKEVIDHWDLSEKRFNVMVSAVLKEKTSQKSFVIGTYHMPCAYYAPKVMTIHADLAVYRVQQLSTESHGVPYICAGDFNIKPKEPVYAFLTSGELDSSSDYHPDTKNGFEWQRKSRVVRSAYAESGEEPDFTNYAKQGDKDPFIDTLDYIFLSDGWEVDRVLPIVARESAGGPFPDLDKDEPSDHVLIAADLSIGR